MDLASGSMFDLNRFVEAQGSNYHDALAELRAGRKRSHWSWYVLPQLRGLGTSPMSIRYGLSGLAEARAYLEHPLLRARLQETVAALLGHGNLSAAQILGQVDARKLQSCLTLFNVADGHDPAFRLALDKFFAGVEDPATLAMLRPAFGPETATHA